MSYIDQNTRNVGLGLVHGTDMVLPFTVTALNELRIEIIPINSGGTIVSHETIPIDENTRNVGAAVTDDANETITPLTINTIVDFPCLRVDVL